MYFDIFYSSPGIKKTTDQDTLNWCHDLLMGYREVLKACQQPSC